MPEMPLELPRWNLVRSALNEFRSCLAPHVPQFSLLAANDYAWTNEEYKRLRPDGFPSRTRGVYLIFDRAEELLYVGSSLVNFDKRVWSHDQLFNSQRVQRRWTDVIVLPSEYAFLAPSLEYFLICKLRPRFNGTFMRHEVTSPGGSCGTTELLS
jgi:hypothetical protein